ncbi:MULTISPECIES: cation:proton antiporter [Candidatus Ichthyocystis]|uniref:Putative sodium: proton antiporter n=1 Tax=Candidatus Ichthyocystis hellenicum TaxID=1561003 RepID=A0A0S4M215_9BURK|nr:MULTISPECIES: cation:proton antiporter [Ichthyocystis]CUT17323.1 putative sodium: proton antiporter [Candidatus Ichthyocystis hellenicum]
MFQVPLWLRTGGCRCNPCRVLLFILMIFSPSVMAAGDSKNILSFMTMALLLLITQLLASFVGKFRLPSVSAEMFVGICLGNFSLLGINLPDAIQNFGKDPMVLFLSDIGLVMLLFEIGLHFDPKTLKSSGVDSFVVAFLGAMFAVVLSVAFIGPVFLPKEGLESWLFIGAALAATSIAVMSRIFSDFGLVHTIESRIILGAALFDDIFGFALLGALAELVDGGEVSYMGILSSLGSAFAFLGACFLIGRPIVKVIVNLIAKKVDNSHAMALVILISLAFVGSYFASYFGLAPIVGAFAAGLMLGEDNLLVFSDEKAVQMINDYLKVIKSESDSLSFKYLEDRLVSARKEQFLSLIFPLKKIFLPLFFIVVGTELNVGIFFEKRNVFLVLVILALAIVSKLLSAIFLRCADRWIVGWGMVPRGEVGLIFLAAGRAYGVIVDPYFSILVAVVIVTTIVSPWVLSLLLHKRELV